MGTDDGRVDGIVVGAAVGGHFPHNAGQVSGCMDAPQSLTVKRIHNNESFSP